MQAPKFHESRLGFQLERFLFLSDGIIAIIITLMVLDIRPPLDLTSDTELLKGLSKLTMKFVGYLISFGIVGHYWTVHHRIFGYVIKYDNNLIWLNLGYLFAVALLPFSSALLGEYSTSEKVSLHIPYLVYVINICLVALFNVLLWLYVSSPGRAFLTHTISPLRIRLGIYRSLILPAVFVFSYFVSFGFPMLARFVPLAIPFVLQYGMIGIEKRMLMHEQTIEAKKTPAATPNETVEDPTLVNT